MRITEKYLRTQIENLNSLVGLAGVPIYRTENGRIIGGNPGVYTLNCAYGGYALHRMSASGSTGIVDIFYGYFAPRILSDKIAGFMTGISAAKHGH